MTSHDAIADTVRATTKNIFFRARDGQWLPIDTPLANIPLKPTREQRTTEVVDRIRALREEIAALSGTRVSDLNPFAGMAGIVR